MAYDEELADRLRAATAGERNVTEKKMFGGLAFLVGGHMAVAANREGLLMVRVDPEESDALVRRKGVERMVMGGREMKGWLRVAAEQTAGERRLQEWVDRGVRFVKSLPAKQRGH